MNGKGIGREEGENRELRKEKEKLGWDDGQTVKCKE